MNIRDFGTIKNGQMTNLYEIKNNKGIRALITDFGATLVSLMVPDKDGQERDVVLGYDKASSYEENTCYLGATVGRYANRIANSRIVIDGVEYHQEANDNENNLHSGPNGTSERIWDCKLYAEDTITFAIEDPDMAQGFPGNAVMEVTYKLTEDNGLSIEYRAKADKTTTFNMTNHSYFNLNGHDSGSIYSHYFQVNAQHYTPVIDAKSIPTGVIAPVEGTPFDFREPKPLGRDIEKEDIQLNFGTGYDHNYAIDKSTSGMEKVARLYSPESGISMEVYTDCIGIQLYTGNFVGGQIGKGGVKYARRDGVCLETQYYPNSINETNFVTPLTKAGEEYHTQTIYKFAIK